MDISEEDRQHIAKDAFHISRNTFLGIAATCILYVVAIYQVGKVNVAPYDGMNDLLEAVIEKGFVAAIQPYAPYMCLWLCGLTIPISVFCAISMEMMFSAKRELRYAEPLLYYATGFGLLGCGFALFCSTTLLLLAINEEISGVFLWSAGLTVGFLIAVGVYNSWREEREAKKSKNAS